MNMLIRDGSSVNVAMKNWPRSGPKRRAYSPCVISMNRAVGSGIRRLMYGSLSARLTAAWVPS
jgi:hypothetical protein